MRIPGRENRPGWSEGTAVRASLVWGDGIPWCERLVVVVWGCSQGPGSGLAGHPVPGSPGLCKPDSPSPGRFCNPFQYVSFLWLCNKRAVCCALTNTDYLTVLEVGSPKWGYGPKVKMSACGLLLRSWGNPFPGCSRLKRRLHLLAHGHVLFPPLLHHPVFFRHEPRLRLPPTQTAALTPTSQHQHTLPIRDPQYSSICEVSISCKGHSLTFSH